MKAKLWKTVILSMLFPILLIGFWGCSGSFSTEHDINVNTPTSSPTSTSTIIPTGSPTVNPSASPGSSPMASPSPGVSSSPLPVYGWTKMTSPGSQALYGVWGSASNNVYAVGNAGSLYRYNGSQWFVDSQGLQGDLKDIWGTSASNIYVVGFDDDVSANRYYVYKYNGSNWQNLDIGAPSNFVPNAVTGTSDSNIYVVGYSDSSTGQIYHYNGSGWSQVHSEAGTYFGFFSVSCLDADNVFAGGGNVFVKYTGGSWQSESTSGINHRGVYAAASNKIFTADADYGLNVTNGNGTWTEIKNTSGDSIYARAVWGLSESNVFVCGSDYYSSLSNSIYRYNGSTLETSYTGSGELYKIWGLSYDNVYAVGGGGTILRYGP